MPAVPLPVDPDLAQLRAFATSVSDAVRLGNPRAIAFLAEHHPDGPPAPEKLGSFPLRAAQLAVARRHGFASWARLERHLALVTELTRTPDLVSAGSDPAEEFLRLGCLTYGDDDPARRSRARTLLADMPEIGRGTLHAAAATNDPEAARATLATDPGAVHRDGGPFGWVPLLYLAYSRIDPAPDPTAVIGTATVLLDAGADPNAGYLWHGMASPFTALTGALGDGEGGPDRQPWHPCWRPLAELLLARGADPNDAQGLYNRMFQSDNSHLELLLGHGLGRGNGGPWKRRLGPGARSPAELVDTQLRWAVSHGMTDRVALLAGHGVALDTVGAEGRTPTDLAVLNDQPAILDVLVAHGAPPPALSPADAMVGALLAGDAAGAERVEADHPGALAAARHARPGLVVWAAASGRGDSIPLLLERGWDVNRRARHDVPVEEEWETALHAAVYRDDIALVQRLLDLGADTTIRDSRYDATPLGWAEHFGRAALVERLAVRTP